MKGDATADARLLTDRWCDDALTKEVDQNGDGNMYSFYYRSRYDFTLSGGAPATSNDLRAGCPATPADPAFDFVAFANTPDSGTGGGPDSDGDGTPDAGDSCPSVDGPQTLQGCPAQKGAEKRVDPACAKLRKKLKKAKKKTAKRKLRGKLRKRGC